VEDTKDIDDMNDRRASPPGRTGRPRRRPAGALAAAVAGATLLALWFNPTTYLPVRVIFAAGWQRIQIDFRWLSPNPVGLSQLSMPIPSGFRQVPAPS
jgi:hypothetical protein